MMNICYCGNAKIIDGIGLSLLSIATTSQEPIACYLLTADVSYIDEEYVPINEMARSFLEKSIQRFNEESKVYLIDCTHEFKHTFSEGRNMHSMYTPFALLRLLMDRIDSLPSKILYLDTDTVAFKDIGPLFDTDISNYPLAVVHDVMRAANYFNSGVVLFNLTIIRKEKSFDAVRDYIFAHKMVMPDQDTLNIVYKDRALFVDRKYNEQRETAPDTVIRHYCQSIRFWPYFHIIKAKPFQKEKFARSYKKDNKLPIFQEFETFKAAYIKDIINKK